LSDQHVWSLNEQYRTLMSARPTIARVRRATPESEPALEANFKTSHNAGHLALLVGMSERGWLAEIARSYYARATFTPSWPLFRTHLLGIALKGTWLAARLGKDGIALYKKELETWREGLMLVDAAAAVVAIGIRHANLAQDAGRALARLRTPLAGEAETPSMTDFRKIVLTSAERVLAAPEEHARRALAVGRELYVKRAAHAPEGSPHRIVEEAKVPDDLARLALLSSDMGVGCVIGEELLELLAVPLVARSAPEDFYWPAEAYAAVGIPYYPWRGILLAERIREWDRKEPARRGMVKVGRNDPCPCGSGKKHKRCCGSE
jgi:hypothetical protein